MAETTTNMTAEEYLEFDTNQQFSKNYQNVIVRLIIHLFLWNFFDKKNLIKFIKFLNSNSKFFVQILTNYV